MVICTKCGFQNSDDVSFCASCGSFLEWTGEKIQPPAAPPAPAEAAETPPERGGLIVQARRALGLEGGAGDAGQAAAGAHGAAPTADVSAGSGAAPGAAVPAPDAAQPPAAPAPVVVTTRRISSAVPFEPQEPAAPIEAAPVAAPNAPDAGSGAPTVEPRPTATTDAAPAQESPAVAAPPHVWWSSAAPGAPQVPQAPAVAPLGPSPTGAPAPATSAPPPPLAPSPTPLAPPPVEPLPVRPGQPLARTPAPTQRWPGPAVDATAVDSTAAGAGAVQPEAVKPGMARLRPAPGPVVPVVEAPAPGEVVCQVCGSGNEASRRFCHRCGASLDRVMPAARRVPWWRSLFSHKATATLAGARPLSVQRHAVEATGGGGGLGRTLALILVGIIVVGAAGYVLVPGVRDAVGGAANQVRMQVAPNYVPVHIAGQATGPSIAGHGPGLAFDEFSNTCWSAPANASQPWIEARFSPPADIAKVLITSGDPANFEAQPRPQAIQLDFMDATGAVVFTKQFDLQDSKDFQTLDVDAKGATSIKLTVLSVYQSTSGKNVSITEVEFRSRQ